MRTRGVSARAAKMRAHPMKCTHVGDSAVRPVHSARCERCVMQRRQSGGMVSWTTSQIRRHHRKAFYVSQIIDRQLYKNEETPTPQLCKHHNRFTVYSAASTLLPAPFRNASSAINSCTPLSGGALGHILRVDACSLLNFRLHFQQITDTLKFAAVLADHKHYVTDIGSLAPIRLSHLCAFTYHSLDVVQYQLLHQPNAVRSGRLRVSKSVHHRAQLAAEYARQTHYSCLALLRVLFLRCCRVIRSIYHDARAFRALGPLLFLDHPDALCSAGHQTLLRRRQGSGLP